jgi:hypothetical protein
MDFNYTLKYKSFDSLLAEIAIDFSSYALEDNIEPAQLIKIVQRVTYDLGLRVNMTKETILDVEHGKARLPNDFYVFNYGLICGEFTVTAGYGSGVGGTQIQEVPYTEFPATVNQCALPTVNCSTCNCNPCTQAIACTGQYTDSSQPTAYDPQNPYGNTCVQPRVFFNCKDEAYELVQVVSAAKTRTFQSTYPLRMKTSQSVDADCPNLHYNTADQGWIDCGFLHTTFQTGKVYLNYQGALEDCDGNLLIPDHPEISHYYEYALKQRILENLFVNGEDVAQRMQFIEVKLREARNRALSIVNTPNFEEMRSVWRSNRKAMYSRYYDMFKSGSSNRGFHPTNNNTNRF